MTLTTSPQLSIALLFALNWLTLILPTMANSPSEFHFNITTVPGYFMQDDPDTDPDTFDYVKSNFGLIPRDYDSDTDAELKNRETTQWQRFEHHLRQLNRNSHPDVSYRLLFLGRHGEGYHNVAENEYGTEAWDCYWSLQNGNENITWLDAHLTNTGIQQAQTARAAWETQIANKIPAPQSYYVSPLNRCLATANITFAGLKMPLTEPFRPAVKEADKQLLRETIGLHTCDKRSPKASIEAEYPLYTFEPSFAPGDDPLWQADWRESNTARNARLRDLLQDIFRHDGNTVLSLTAHSGAIQSVLSVTGHRDFKLLTGAMVPLLVKVEKVAGKLPRMEVDPPEGKPDCSK